MPAKPDTDPPPGAPAATPRRKRDLEVVAAAAKVFHARGYSAATVQDVADELGILKGSLYHYIKSKEDLLFRLFEIVHEEVEAILQEVLSADGLDPLARLVLYVRRQILHNLQNLGQISIYYHELDRLGPERRRFVIAWRRRHDRFMANLIREAQAEGLIDASSDPELLTNCVFATIIWPYRWFRPGLDGSPEAMADACAAFVRRGLTGDAPFPRLSLGTAA